MTVDERVDALEQERVADILKQIVRTVKENGHGQFVPGILRKWSLIGLENSCVGETLQGKFEGITITARAIKDENGLVHWHSDDLQYEGIITKHEWEYWRAKEGQQ